MNKMAIFLYICASDLLLRFSHLLCGLGDRSGVKDVKMGVVLQFQILYIAKLVLKLKLHVFFIESYIFHFILEYGQHSLLLVLMCMDQVSP